MEALYERIFGSKTDTKQTNEKNLNNNKRMNVKAKKQMNPTAGPKPVLLEFSASVSALVFFL